MNISTKPTSKLKPLSLAVWFAAACALTACGGGSDSSDNTSANSGNTNSDNTSSNTNGDNKNSGNKNSTTSTALQTNAAIAKNLVDNLAIPAYKAFANKSAGLSGTVSNYCAAIGKTNEAGALTAAQSAWLTLKNEWQGTLLYAVGPVAANNGNLARRIYTANRFDSATKTFVSNEVAKRKADANYRIAATAVNSARGLDALEYLLYTPETDTSKKRDNCNYAVAVAKDVKAGADAIVTAWSSSAGRNTFLTNKQRNGVDLVQPFFDNIITVVDKNLKDAGLGMPLALKSGGECRADACPNLVENRLSKSSYDSIKANLVTLEKLYTGNGGAGFKIYYDTNKLSSQGAAFQKLIANAKVAVASAKPLVDQVAAINTAKKGAACKTVSSTGQTNDADLKACATYYAVKRLSDEVKTGSFKAAVNLELPSQAAGDGD